MNSTSNHLKLREIINQVVNDPAYKAIAKIPLISPYQIGLILFAYTCFLGGIYLHLAYKVSLWIVYPIMTFGVFCAYTPLHEGTHHALSSNKFINDVLGTISGFLLVPFVNMPSYRYLHLAHHRYVGDEDLDPDEMFVRLPTRYPPFGYLILFFPDLLWGYWSIFKGWKRISTRLKIYLMATFAGTIIFHVAWFVSPYWYEFLLLFVIPSRLGSFYTAFAFAHIQHTDGVEWSEHPFKTTYKIQGSWYYLKSLLAQSDHWLHHFLPHIPWYRYKAATTLANGVFFKQGIPQRTALSIPDRHFKKRLLEQPSAIKTTFQVKVKTIATVAKDIKHFTFESLDGTPLPDFTAGAHIPIHLPSGQKRMYSLLNPPFDKSKYEIAVKLEPNGLGGSKEMHEQIQEDNTLTIGYPKNNFVLYENVQKYILIAGGIGITPLLSMTHRLTELEKYFELHICAKHQENIPFQYELENMTFAPNVEFHLDKNGKSTIDLSAILAAPNTETLIYVCGPLGFNNWVKQTAQDMGWQAEQIKQEVFTRNVSEFAKTKPFEIVLNKSGKSMTVEKDLTIIDTLLLNGVKVEYTCLQGTCGTCVTKVIEGEIDHRDSVLSEEEKMENDKMCLCVSRAKSGKIILNM